MSKSKLNYLDETISLNLAQIIDPSNTYSLLNFEVIKEKNCYIKMGVNYGDKKKKKVLKFSQISQTQTKSLISSFIINHLQNEKEKKKYNQLLNTKV